MNVFYYVLMLFVGAYIGMTVTYYCLKKRGLIKRGDKHVE